MKIVMEYTIHRLSIKSEKNTPHSATFSETRNCYSKAAFGKMDDQIKKRKRKVVRRERELDQK